MNIIESESDVCNMKNLLILFLFTFVWVSLLPLYPAGEQKANELPDEEYVLGVMLGMGTDVLPDEALKAIAVTVRTYSAYHGKVLPVSNKNKISAAVGDEQGEKVYNSMRNAVYSTAGEYLTYGEKVINACFHTSSYKNTAEGDAPYLQSVSTPDESSYPAFFAVQTVADTDMLSFGKGKAKSVNYGADGKVKSVVMEGGTVSVREFISAFKICSADFTLNTLPDGGYRISTRGVGEGYGLSLYGGYLMATEGKTYREILAHYFSGTALARKT